MVDFKSKKAYRTEISPGQWAHAEEMADQDLRYALLYELMSRVEALEAAIGKQARTVEIRVPEIHKGASGIDLRLKHDRDLIVESLTLGPKFAAWMADYKTIDGTTSVALATGTPLDIAVDDLICTIVYDQLAGTALPVVAQDSAYVNEAAFNTSVKIAIT